MRAGPAVALALAACGSPRAPAGPPAAPSDAMGFVVDEEALQPARLAAIEKAMNDLAAVAPQCWAAAAVDDYQLAGEITLLITVADDPGGGRVEVRSDSARDPVLTACLVAVAEAYRWPEPMWEESAQLPFAFTAPSGQNVIDRALIPEVADGARVLLDGRNSGNRAASMFELVVPAGATHAATASQRDEVWVFLDAPGAGSLPTGQPLDAAYLPPGAVRALVAPADAPLHVLIVATPGGDEDATRRSGVLPASPADRKNKKAPKAVVLSPIGATVAERARMGTVTLQVEPARGAGKAVASSRLDIIAGAVIPPHVHDASTELLYVRSGVGRMVVGGVELPVTATSVVQIPAGVEHSFEATEAMTVLQFYTPAGPEQRFKPAGR